MPENTKKRSRSRSGASADAPTGKRRESVRVRPRSNGGSSPPPLPAVSRDTGTSEVERFVTDAIAHVGYPYVWGTQGPGSFDCSGLVQWSYRVATGKTITPSSYAQFTLGVPVERGKIRRGDLVFWDTENNGTAGHVGVAISGSRIVSAMNESTGVIESPIDGSFGGPYLGARRLPFAAGTVGPDTPEQTVTPQTGFREAGNTDLDSFRHALARSVTPGRVPPPLAEADAIYRTLYPYHLTRLAAGMAWIERSNETNDDDLQYYGRELHNLWAIKQSDGAWAHYPSYADAAEQWANRVLGPVYADLHSIAEFIGRYAPWIDGNNPTQYGSRLAGQISALARIPDEPGPSPDPDGDPDPAADFREWTVPGYPKKWRLPKDIVVEIHLTPVGVHRPGQRITVTGSTLHETGNRGNGKGARMHSTWQDGCTEGHPDLYVGVSMYVENRLVIIKIPGDESSIHSGDWRNNAHPSMELCVNADRNAEQTEDTAMWVQANILWSRDQNADEDLYSHTTSGCPAIINGQRRWPSIVTGTDERLGILKSGGPVPNPDEYAPIVKIPRTWDGTDYVRASDGAVFTALSRVFVTTKKTAARQSASPTAKKVRRDLNAGEAFLSHYTVAGSDGHLWIVSQFGSRIAAGDCSPNLSSLDDEPGMRVRGNPVVNDPHAGLDATAVEE